MKILANVTSSLLGDYNEVVDYLGRNINGDTYFTTTLFKDVDRNNFDITDYDFIVNVFNDESDVLDDYYYLYDLVKANNMINDFVVYAKSKEFYTDEKLYYSRKNANSGRLHRFLEYVDTDEIVFDIMAYASLYFNADVNISNGMLKLKNYDVLDLGAVRFCANNDVLNRFYKKVLVAREEEQSIIQKASIDDDASILRLEQIRNFLDNTYKDYDRFLEYAFYMYREIIYSFSNKTIHVLDYLFSKEYFEIGHFTSISSCYYRDAYKNLIEDNSVNFKDLISIMKLTIYSMAFAENNKFVIDIIKQIFDLGKQLELREGVDDFFYYHSSEFAKKIGLEDDGISRYNDYITLIESGKLKAKNKNVLRAYRSLIDYYNGIGNVDEAINYALKSFDYAMRDIDIATISKSLFEMYRIKADKINEEKYIAKACKYSYLMDNGYHDDYGIIAVSIINTESHTDIDKNWKYKVIDSGLNCKYINNEIYYYLSLKKLFDMDNGMSDKDRIAELKKISNEMVEHFYVRPMTMYVGIYNSLLVLASLYEKTGDETNASSCYENAYKYLSVLENMNEDIDKEIAYVQFKLGDMAIDMDSNKSYRQLAKADRRMYGYIIKTKKYVDFYADLLIVINERYFKDMRKRAGGMVTKNNLNKLINCCTLNNEYLRDTAIYCEKMADMYRVYGDLENGEVFAQLHSNYIKLCKEKDVAITR